MEGAGGVGGLLAIERNVAGSNTWDIRYTHADANGNIIALTNSSGAVSARYRYDAFGKTINAADVDNSGWVNHNIHGFSSKPSFGNQGLLYYGYRWYSPSLGRWINRDPIEESGGMNLYGFVGNDGVRNWDYLGNKPSLTMKTGEVDLGKCGSFSWKVDFAVSPKTRKAGEVLQEVNAAGSYQNYDQFGSLTGEPISIGPTTNPYFEIWDVSPAMSDTAEDTFKLWVTQDLSGKTTSEIGKPNTVGSFTISGWARFYPDIDHDTAKDSLRNQGWSNDEKANGTWAGSLWAGPKNPNWDRTNTSSLVKHSITVKWDCCGSALNDTEIVNQEPK
jgi:RHS repeat-associated protein